MQADSLSSMENPSLQQVYGSYVEALRHGDRRKALGSVKAALSSGHDIRDIYLGVLQPAMHEIGRMWEINQFTVAQEHLATAITQSVMAQIYGSVFMRPAIGRTMVATCIGGELHELGIRMVADFFEMEGWDVFYLGANVPSQSVVQMVEERRADLLALSITLSTHLPELKELIATVRRSTAGERIKIMVGGQPLNQTGETAASLGADFIARDAREAVARAAEIVK